MIKFKLHPVSSRLLTAAVLLPTCIAGIQYLPALWFAIITAGIVLLAAWEWGQFVAIQSPIGRAVYAAIVGVMLGMTFYVPIVDCFVINAILWIWAAAATIYYGCRHHSHHALGFAYPALKALTGGFFLMAFWLAINILRNTMMGPKLLLFALILIWSVDTGAYIVGSVCGKHRLIPRISPNKTWEGLAAGVVLCVLIALAYGLSKKMPWPVLCSVLGLACLTAIAAVVGDLFESLLKRQAQIKDSGNLLPGHGGILDRLDSTIAALPIFALVLVFF